MTDELKFSSYSLPWRDLPGLLPESAEVFAIGDVHGQADLLERVLEDIRNTPRNGAVRHLVFLGDLIDRGPSSVGAVDLAMRGTTLANADILHVLPGNHDLALHFGLLSPDLLSLWISGGGKTVLSELGMSKEDNSVSEIQGELRKVMHPDYLQLMAEGPTSLQLGDLLIVHAGVHPYGDIPDFLDQERFFIGEEYHWATIRYPFLSHREGWNLRDPDPDRRDRKPTVIVHGHNRLIHASARRWGRLIELIINALANVCVDHPDRKGLLITDFATVFERWTGVSVAANVFLVENPYRIETGILYKQ